MRADLIQRSWLFGLMMLIAVALPAAFTVASFNAYRHSADAIARSEQLRGEIRRLDEVLTMSARMAATTGEGRWITRYNDNVDPLDQAIKEMLDLAGSPAATQRVHATDAANVALIAMETRSFELVHAGHRREAYALLTSAEYERQKAIYAAGMAAAMSMVHEGFAAETAQSWRGLIVASVFSVLGVFICFIVWSRLMRRSFRKQQHLAEVAGAERDAATAANAAKSSFLANMSHELRTPLNAVIGYSEMLREGAEEDGRKSDITDHDRVIGAAKRLLTLIDDLLDLSKAEAGKIVLKPREFDVRDLVEATLATVAPAAAARGNRSHFAAANDLGVGLTDEFRLGQCLLNLLSNAAKFTRDGEITTHARRETSADGDWLVFEIADTGVGMTEAQVSELFQPFVQVETAVAQAHGGTGLGLAITRQLARLLGGDVEVQSRPGEGSLFTVRVPACLPGYERACAPTPAQALAAA